MYCALIRKKLILTYDNVMNRANRWCIGNINIYMIFEYISCLHIYLGQSLYLRNITTNYQFKLTPRTLARIVWMCVLLISFLSRTSNTNVNTTWIILHCGLPIDNSAIIIYAYNFTLNHMIFDMLYFHK